MSRRPIERMKRKVIGLLRSAKILIIRSLAQSRIMVFQKITEVGNLCRAGRTLEKNRATPGTPPPMGGADPLARQQFSRRDSVERRANVSGIIELPPTDQGIRERIHGVTVVTFQVVDQTGRDSRNCAIRYWSAALKGH